MVSFFEKKGFEVFENSCKDLELFLKDDVALISMHKFKGDKKAFRQSSNHLDRRLITELINALDLFKTHKGIRAVILTSSHKVAFSRGAKIELLLDATENECRDFITRAQELILRIQSFPKPVIAAINGLTLGGGLELALACDYRITSSRENVIFGMPEVSLGIIPGMGGTQNLPRIVGRERAFKIICEARIDILPDEAEAINLVDKVVPPEDLISECYSFAKLDTLQKAIFGNLKLKPSIINGTIQKEIQTFLTTYSLGTYSEGAPLSEALITLISEKTVPERYTEGLLYELEVISYLQKTDDCREGLMALTEERDPVFKGQ